MASEFSDLKTYYDGLFDEALDRIREFKPEHFIPNPNHILVRVAPKDERTQGGLLIPDVAQEEKRIGVVLAIHPQQRDNGFPYKPGDTVFFRSYGGEKLPFEGADDLFVLQVKDGADSDVLGRFDTSGAIA